MIPSVVVQIIANPAVTVGRMFGDSFAGIAPATAPGFILSQLAGSALAAGLVAYLWPAVNTSSAAVVVPHESNGSERRPPMAARQ